MKKLFNKLVLVMAVTCTIFLSGCAKDNQDPTAIITEHKWKVSEEESLLVCEKDETFKYYRYADDMTDSYYSGTYEFYMGEEAITYMETELSDYGITRDELEEVFNSYDSYKEDNFICLVLNNEACIIEGENQIETPYQTPYFGFYLEEDNALYLDLVNMNAASYILFVAE